MSTEDLDDAVQAWLDATDPTGSDVSRAKRRLEAHAEAPGYDPALLALLPGPADGAELRIRNRLAQPQRAPRRLWVLAPIGAAAAALMLLGPWSEPGNSVDAPLVEGLVEAPPEALAVADTTPLLPETEVRIGPHVVLRSQGEGRVGGTDDAPRIDWSAGQLAVQVEPDQGVDLQIETPDALVRVVGTVFDVDRGFLGTTVTVQRGKVEVRCAGEEPQLVPGGASAECWSAEPAALLARARGAAAPSVALDAAERGLTTADGPVAAELRHARIEALVELGRTDAARAACDDYLARPVTPRRAEVEGVRARLGN